ncbi:hypothetical protein SBDP1_890008 [Syntrophobacter sp. SbD1]|nr:hypothetical protein SBDP1_890008 [Syntrophobacter sp. SbD1]
MNSLVFDLIEDRAGYRYKAKRTAAPVRTHPSALFNLEISCRLSAMFSDDPIP